MTKEEAIKTVEAVYNVDNAKELFERIEHFGFSPFEIMLVIVGYVVGYKQGADLPLPGF